ncbi:hypothetical protein ACWKWC_12135 [Geodermatophilus nigrescens]
MTGRDKQRFEAAAEGTRQHGEDQVIRRHGSVTPLSWALKSLAISVVLGVLGYFVGGWSTAIIFFVVWAGAAVVQRIYAKRLLHRRESR